MNVACHLKHRTVHELGPRPRRELSVSWDSNLIKWQMNQENNGGCFLFVCLFGQVFVKFGRQISVGPTICELQGPKVVFID